MNDELKVTVSSSSFRVPTSSFPPCPLCPLWLIFLESFTQSATCSCDFERAARAQRVADAEGGARGGGEFFERDGCGRGVGHHRAGGAQESELALVLPRLPEALLAPVAV